MAALLAVGARARRLLDQIADMPLVGVPADAPARPKEAGAYLPVHDMPPDRERRSMTAGGAGQDRDELVAARDRQASSAQRPRTPPQSRGSREAGQLAKAQSAGAAGRPRE